MQCTIDRLDADRAQLRTPDGQTFTIPLTELPDGAGEGDRVDLRCTNGDASKSDPKDILNEILGNGSTSFVSS